ncbi:MAG: right-handed parallel beta-helix repeat-containing protein [Candidatus Zixiibacteriota bacterium]
MQFSKLLSVSILLIIVVYLPSYSSLYYVSPEGNNNNNGRTPETAWRNVSYATQQVGNDPSDPDSVLIFPGVYNPGAGETFPVMVRSYTALIGVDTGVVLEANSDTLPVIGVLEETAFWIENLEITEGVIGIFLKRCSDFCIYNNRVHHNRGRGLKIRGNKRFKILENAIASNTGGGLVIQHGKQILITGNTITMNSGKAIGPPYSKELVGGGISILSSRGITINGNVIGQNELTYHGEADATGKGGGISVRDSYNITLLGNTITGNEVDISNTVGGVAAFSYGGGVYVGGSEAVKIRGNLISHNRLSAASSELAISRGGGIFAGYSAANVIIRRNRIEQNRTISDAYESGGGGMFFDFYAEGNLQKNIITGNHVIGYGGGVCVNGRWAGEIVIGGEPGGGNDIYGNSASLSGDELGCFDCRDTLTATFNYFDGTPQRPRVAPPENWDTRFWRDNSILENEPPHILSYFPTCAETTLYVGDSLLFWIESLDYDGDSTFTWWLLNGQQVAQGDSLLFVAEPQHVGYDTVQVNVSDGRSLTSHEWYLEVIGERFASPEKLSSLPKAFALQGNYPNPFNLSTVIQYQLPVDCYVRLEVYDLLGRKVATLAEGEQKAGYRSFIWDASKVSSSIYIYKLTAGDFTQARKMMLVK